MRWGYFTNYGYFVLSIGSGTSGTSHVCYAVFPVFYKENHTFHNATLSFTTLFVPTETSSTTKVFTQARHISICGQAHLNCVCIDQIRKCIVTLGMRSALAATNGHVFFVSWLLHERHALETVSSKSCCSCTPTAERSQFRSFRL